MGACRSNRVDTRHLEPCHQCAQRHAEWGDARDASPWKRARERAVTRARCSRAASAHIGGPDQQTGNDAASDFLHELLPKAVRVTVLVNPALGSSTETTLRDVQEAAVG
jgi:hypothetical protein